MSRGSYLGGSEGRLAWSVNVPAAYCRRFLYHHQACKHVAGGCSAIIPIYKYCQYYEIIRKSLFERSLEQVKGPLWQVLPH